MKVKVKDLAIGSEFSAGPATLRILDHFTDGTTFVIAAKSIGDRPFNIYPFLYEFPERRTIVIADEIFRDGSYDIYSFIRELPPKGFNLNDWRTSTIRKDLNENFLSALQAAGKIDTNRIVTTEWDLSDPLGGAGYGTSRDKIGLLSEKQFERYAEKGLLEPYNWWWLITPNYAHTECSDFVRIVDDDGKPSNHYAYIGDGGVRPAFRLESETEVELP